MSRVEVTVTDLFDVYLRDVGFDDDVIDTACVVTRDAKRFPVFLATARRR